MTRSELIAGDRALATIRSQESAQVSAWMTKDYLEEKYIRGTWSKFEQVLAKVPDVEPEDYGKL
jgi:hypothetical protein